MQVNCSQFAFLGISPESSFRISFEDLPTTLFGEACYSFNSRGRIDKQSLVLERDLHIRSKRWEGVLCTHPVLTAQDET